jgi:predicted RNA-binding Zn-ribbon protein involved in translation (DUF1610 family)
MDENFLNSECPMCGDEGAYFDFNHWECPNCDHSWGGMIMRQRRKRKIKE